MANAILRERPCPEKNVVLGVARSGGLLCRAVVFAVVAARVALIAAAEDLPRIRFTAEAPFKDGKRVESIWARADTCTRFLEVVRNEVALDQSEVRMLFDAKNLYVTMKGFFDPKFERGKPGASESNDFRFNICLEGRADNLQVIASEFAKLYVARTGARLRNHGVTQTVERGKGFWITDLTIPLAALGLAVAPAGDLRVKVGLFRNNINAHERQKLYSMTRRSVTSFTPNQYNFGESDTWADMVLTRKKSEARRVTGPDMGYRINLFPNSDFDVPGRVWSQCGKTAYRESMAMSGEWIYRASGKDYRVLQTDIRWMKPMTRYTLVVKARSFGSACGLRVVEEVRDAGGRTHEGVYPASLIPIGPEMHEYYIPFTSHAEDPCWLVFYKVDDRADDTGIDFASIRIFEGEISTFEIRRIGYPGRMARVEGTEVPVPPSAYGRFPKPLRALVLVTDKYSLREPAEIFAGTGARFDFLMMSGADQDVYLTDSGPKAITAALKNGEYDLYMIPKGGAARVGKELAGHILGNVKKGAGLYFESNLRAGHFKEIEKGGMFGRGRVHLAKLAGRQSYLPVTELGECGEIFLPRAKVFDPQVAADAYRTAFGDQPPAVRKEREVFVYGGKRHVVVKGLDASGNTVSWMRTTEPVAGAKLGAFTDDGTVARIAVEGDSAGLRLRWSFADFSGRVLARGEMPAGAEVPLDLPRRKLYTNFGGVRLELVKDGVVVDARGESVFVPANDRARLYDDFTPSMWPPVGTVESMPAQMRQLEEIGIRASVIPMGGLDAYGFFLSMGIGVGSGWVGGGEIFCGRPQKGNVRQQQYNTAAARKAMADRARKEGARLRRYGLLDYALCDEPNLSCRGNADELDAHPENLAAYREYMRRKYGTIAEYNRRHETSYGDFADLNQAIQADARKSGKFAEFIEWRNFNVDRWVEAIRIVADGTRECDPEVPFTMCNTFGQSALSGNDYWKLLTKANLGCSIEYTSMVYFGRSPLYNFDEFIRSFRPDMRVWGWTGYFYTRDRARFMPWWFAAHRYGGFSWYAANAWGYNIVDPTTFALTVDGRDLKASLDDSRLLDGLGKVLTCWPWARRDTAIYYSHDSMLLSTILGTETKNGEINEKGPLHDYMHSRMCAQYTVEDLLYQHDFVAPEQVVTQNRLANVKALLLPRILAMSDAEVAAVKAYLAKGGKAICDELPGGYDELGVKRAANPFAGARGLTVLGRNFNDLDKDCRAAVKGFLGAAGATKALGCDDMVAHFGREAMHYVSGDADVYAVIRMPGRSEDDDTLDFTFAKKGHVYDVRAQKYLGETDRVTAKTPLPEASVFAVLPAKITGISISGLPAKVTAGADLPLDFTIKLSNSQPVKLPNFVLHVEVVPPSGKTRFHMKRNLMTQDGKAHLGFATALNDEKGAWKLRVTEPLTGVTSEKSFTVR